jgi:hypothetical protein
MRGITRAGFIVTVVVALAASSVSASAIGRSASADRPNTAKSQSPVYTPVVTAQRSYSHIGQITDVNGHPFKAVKGVLYIRSNTYSSTASVSDIALCQNPCSDFAQLGIFQGNFPNNDENASPCSPVSNTLMTLPHLFVGYHHPTAPCTETLMDLGTFGTLGYRTFEIDEDSRGGFDFYLDGVFKLYIGGIFGGAYDPTVSGETGDTCSFMYVRANTAASPYNTLQRMASGQPWALWGANSEVRIGRPQTNPSSFQFNEPTPGSPAQFLTYGPNDGTGC